MENSLATFFNLDEINSKEKRVYSLWVGMEVERDNLPFCYLDFTNDFIPYSEFKKRKISVLDVSLQNTFYLILNRLK